jgi:hypothetical protein
MPSQLAPGKRSSLRRQAKEVQGYVELPIDPPWGGYMPDPPVSKLTYGAFRDVRNLVVRQVDTHGEFLMLDVGYAKIDSARLPLGVGPLPAATGLPITMLGVFPRYSAGSKSDVLGMAATSGGPGVVASFSPVTGQWALIAHSGAVNSTAIAGSREFMHTFTVFPFGTTTRKDNAGAAKPIAVPTYIFCNYADPVYVYPNATAGTAYESLVIDTATGGTFFPFHARSCEAYDERATFLNTREGNSYFERRLRWSPQGNCDIDPNNVGAGYMDFTEFRRQGLRNLRLGDAMACYFEDGVALVRRTGIRVAPLQRQYVSHQRGLLGTHAVCQVGENSHFGIFNDGWFFLAPSGEWREAGVEEIDGVRVHKWRETFYRRLDIDKRNRIVCQYWPAERAVYVLVPTVGTSDNAEMWKYDIDANRVWIRSVSSTMLGIFDRQLRTATTYGALAGRTYGSLVGTKYGDWAARFGLDQMVHGTLGGLVMGYDQTLYTEDGVTPTYYWKSHELSHGDPSNFKTFDRLLAVYERLGASTQMAAVATADNGNRSDPQVIDLSRGYSGAVGRNYANFRLAGTHLGFELSGQGPVMLRSLRARFIQNRVLDKREA